MKTQVNPGNTADIASAPYAAVSGAGMLVGSLFGIVAFDCLISTPVTLALNGTFTVVKVSAQAWTVGQLIYWDDTAKLCTTVVGTNKIVGVAYAAAGNPSATGQVRLNGAYLS